MRDGLAQPPVQAGHRGRHLVGGLAEHVLGHDPRAAAGGQEGGLRDRGGLHRDVHRRVAHAHHEHPAALQLLGLAVVVSVHLHDRRSSPGTGGRAGGAASCGRWPLPGRRSPPRSRRRPSPTSLRRSCARRAPPRRRSGSARARPTRPRSARSTRRCARGTGSRASPRASGSPPARCAGGWCSDAASDRRPTAARHRPTGRRGGRPPRSRWRRDPPE